MVILSPWPWELDEVLQNFTYINGRLVIYLSHLALSENQGTQVSPGYPKIPWVNRYLMIPIKKTIGVHAHDETNPKSYVLPLNNQNPPMFHHSAK